MNAFNDFAALSAAQLGERVSAGRRMGLNSIIPGTQPEGYGTHTMYPI